MSQKWYFVRLVALCAVIGLQATAPVARADEEKAWALDLAVGTFSDYMFRGFNLYDGTSIQPSATLSWNTGYGTVSGNLWMHLSGEGDRQEEKFTELDETIAYQTSWDPVTLKVGHVWYTYPADSDDITESAEFFATAVIDDSSFNPLLPLSPTLSVYHDYDAFDAQYYELGLSHAFTWDALGEGFNFTPFVAFGFASSAEGVYTENGLVQVTCGTSFTAQIGDVAVVPSLNYTFESDDSAVNEFWTGVSFAYRL